MLNIQMLLGDGNRMIIQQGNLKFFNYKYYRDSQIDTNRENFKRLLENDYKEKESSLLFD